MWYQEMKNVTLQELLFIDDIVLSFETKEKLQQKLGVYKELI